MTDVQRCLWLPLLCAVAGVVLVRSFEVPPAAGQDKESATASFYGPEFENTRTASGEPYDPDKLTAAHKRLPLGTKVRVTNPRNRRKVTVRVNDRGPFKRGRDIDLSQGAARSLGIEQRGVVSVVVEVVATPAATSSPVSEKKEN